MDSSAFQIGTIVEAALVIVNLLLFSYGYPNASRTALWEEGGRHGFNSNPKLRIYFYANYLEPPEIPFIWSQVFTDSNLGVSILTLLLFMTRTSVRYAAGINKLNEFFLQCCLLFFWILCLVAQQLPDYSDGQHPSRLPWYLTHTCVVAQKANQTVCYVAQASFGFSIITTLFYGSLICIIAACKVFIFLGNCKRTKTKIRHLKWDIYSTPYEMDSIERAIQRRLSSYTRFKHLIRRFLVGLMVIKTH